MSIRCEKPQGFVSEPERERVSWFLRILLVVFVAFLQVGFFYLVFKIYALIPYTEYFDISTKWDSHVPYIPWSWTLYYFGFAYIALWGSAGIWRMPRRPFLRTIAIYSVMVLVGAALHLAIPTRAPWPLVHDLTAVQQSFKATLNIEPLSCFPSMHVAMAVLPAFIGVYVFKSLLHRIISVVLALLVSASVVTAKEHWLLDVLGGVALGIAAGWSWKAHVLKSRITATWHLPANDAIRSFPRFDP